VTEVHQEGDENEVKAKSSAQKQEKGLSDFSIAHGNNRDLGFERPRVTEGSRQLRFELFEVAAKLRQRLAVRA
jgi:hypothetical protein